MIYRLYLIILSITLLYVPVVYAHPNNAPKKTATNAIQTQISADSLTYSIEKQIIVFNTNVNVLRPDFKLTSEKLTIYLEQNSSEPAKGKEILPGGLSSGEIQKIVAENNVRIVQGEHEGKCNKAIYDTKTGIILLEGNPSLQNGKNIVTGTAIKYYTLEQRSEVIGDPTKRVEAIFSSSPKQKSPDKHGKINR